MITNKRPDPLQPTEDSVVFAAEASELGWPPNYREEAFMLYGAEFKLVAGVTNDEGELVYYLYYSHSIGKHAKIFND